METTTILALVAIGSFIIAVMGFLAAQYWNLKKINLTITRELEDKVDKLQIKITEHESRFELVAQRMETTTTLIDKLESTVTANLSKLDDKLDKILEYMIDKNH